MLKKMCAANFLWTVPRLLEATGGRLLGGSATAPIGGIAIDSRRLQPGEAFVAITGRRLEGHDFLDDALDRGASCLIVSREISCANGSSDVPVIRVPETTIALGHLARAHRRRFPNPIIAVTGSCGKTTTKELIAHLLGGPERVLKTEGTQNNHIGVPLTLLRLSGSHAFAVIELGSNHPGEIAYLASLAQPDVAVLTNVGPVHLEFFGTLAGVLQEKLSLLDALSSEGTAVMPGDQLDVCLEASKRLPPSVRRVTFGTSDRCDLQALDLQAAPWGTWMRLRDHLGRWTIPLMGYHNAENALAALACVWALDAPLAQARERLATVEAVPLRSQVLKCGGITILNDCYNANPLSMARAMETLCQLDVRRRVAVLGDMLELGSHAATAHHAIGRLAAQMGVDVVLGVGEYAEVVVQGAQESPEREGVELVTYPTVAALMKELPAMLHEGDGVLIKGSRRLRLEQVTEHLLQSSDPVAE
jgi:UDP-N-acetylmuramoyl-tripeptide--D-alanyl-D-alanine ligase